MQCTEFVEYTRPKNMYTLKVKLAFSLIRDFNVPAVSHTNNQFHAMKLLTCNIWFKYKGKGYNKTSHYFLPHYSYFVSIYN